MGSLAPLLEYLRGIGAAPVPGPVPPASPADALLARYAGYLAAERGLSAKTIDRHVRAVRPFLESAARGGQPDLGLGRLTAREVMDFVVGQSRQRHGSVPHLVTGLRSLLRFLHVDGVTAAGLATRSRGQPGASSPACRSRCPPGRWPRCWPPAASWTPPSASATWRS